MSIVYFAVFGHSRLAVGVTSPLLFHLFLFLLFVKVYLDIYSFKSMLETWGWLFGLFFIPLTLGMDVLVAALLFLNVHNMIFIILSIQPIDLRIFWTGCCMFNVVSCCEISKLSWCVLRSVFISNLIWYINFWKLILCFLINSVLERFWSMPTCNRQKEYSFCQNSETNPSLL